MKLARAAFGCVTLAVACACSARPVDRDVAFGGSPASPGPIENVPVKGYHATVETHAGSVSGELIAMSPEALFLMTDDGATLALATADVAKVSVKLYGDGLNAGLLAAWGGAGMTSTLSHGIFLIFTAPTWLLVGLGTSIPAGFPAKTVAYRPDLPRLYEYARFPQGLPKGWPVVRVDAR